MSGRLPDENVLVIPDAWRAAIHPRRGGVTPVPEIAFDPSAPGLVRERLRAVRAGIERGLDGEREIVKSARAYLRGEADPAGAAVIARLELMETPAREEHPAREPWIDTWVAEHGLAFAACAFAEVDQLTVRRDAGDLPFTIEHGEHYHGYAYYQDRVDWALDTPGRRMRALLATAAEGDYAEAVQRLAGHRRNPKQKCVVSYLVPTRRDWVDECLGLAGLSGLWAEDKRLLWCAVGSMDQAGRLDYRAPYEHYPPPDFGFLPGMLASVIDGVGPAIAPTLAKAIDPESEIKVRKAYLDALALIPTDEAFGLMAERLDHGDVRPVLMAMTERFPRRALRMLAPLAAGGSKRARPVVLLLAEHLRTWPELDAELPDQARQAIEAAGGARVPEADDLPKALASGQAQDPPAWAAPAFMPQLLLRGRKQALPASATALLIEALSRTGPRRAPAAGVRDALEACDPGSLAEFGWALFDRWRTSGDVSDNGWPLSQLRWTGDAETARRLGAMTRAATFYDGYRLALNALGVLAATGSDVALIQLSLSAQKAKPKGLKKRARKLLDALAKERGLTPEQLADRLVPDFGLDAEGSMTLDYGPRRFTVGFDEQLRPQVIDDSGKLRKSLPKPGVKDDPELAPAAHRAFAGLKKDVRALAGEQIRRLERAMVERRRWEIGEFRELLVHHPLLWNVTRRLVWSHEEGGKTTAFRLAEDRTMADVDDDVLTLPATGVVSIAHPVHLGDDTATWSETFADYEILQPFPQLGRPTYTLSAEERAAGDLTRFAGRATSAGKALGTERQGWVRSAPEDGGVQHSLTLDVPGGPTLSIQLSPGLPAWNPAYSEDQEIVAVQISGEACFGDLDPVTASELLLTLHTLTDGT
jgi:hypothetical protein